MRDHRFRTLEQQREDNVRAIAELEARLAALLESSEKKNEGAPTTQDVRQVWRDGRCSPTLRGRIYLRPRLQRHREGTDTATRVAKACQGSMTAQAEANRLQKRGEMEDAAQYQLRADQEAQQALDQTPATLKVEMATGEVVPTNRLDIRDTLTAPDAAALDASARRIDLLARTGIDSVALGVDAPQSIGARDEPGETCSVREGRSVSSDDPDIKPEKKARSLARMRRYRARIRRFDYAPSRDVRLILEDYMARHPKDTIQ
ncbi:MAG: hypothetical protein ABW318_08065, partial [Vicinamibacterales bacterium]